MIEIFFGIITRQAIRRGTFDSVAALKAAIRRFIDAYNDRCEPFAWTRTADELLTKIDHWPTVKDFQHGTLGAAGDGAE